MEVFQAIESRRSIRKFQPAPLPGGTVEKLLQAMQAAPSGKNAQPWKFIVVQKPETRRSIAEACTFYTSSGREIRQDWIAEAPVIFVVCGDPRNAFVKIRENGRLIIANHEFLNEKQAKETVDWETGLLVDLTIPMDHLSLAATAEGLGGCWVAGLDEERVKEILSIPAGWRAPAVMPVGYPAENPEARRRKPLDEIVCWERFNA
jgi:nitroreductase